MRLRWVIQKPPGQKFERHASCKPNGVGCSPDAVSLADWAWRWRRRFPVRAGHCLTPPASPRLPQFPFASRPPVAVDQMRPVNSSRVSATRRKPCQTAAPLFPLYCANPNFKRAHGSISLSTRPYRGGAGDWRVLENPSSIGSNACPVETCHAHHRRMPMQGGAL